MICKETTVFPASTSAAAKTTPFASIVQHRHRSCPLSNEDCESIVTMKIRCRRGQLVVLLQVLALLSVLMNAFLVCRLMYRPSNETLPKRAITEEGGDTTFIDAELDDLELPEDATMQRKDLRLLGVRGTQGQTRKRVLEDNEWLPMETDLRINTQKRETSNKSKSIQKRNKKGPATGLQQQQKRGHRGRTHSQKKPRRPVKVDPREASMSPDATFSACLLIKDDNEILNEWIAYHYHTIRMRNLVVAVDPLSYQSPSRLLEKWRLMTDLDVMEWTDEQYMPASFLETGRPPEEYMQKAEDFKTAMSDDDLLEISVHRYRQRVFLAQCMSTLRQKGKTWVIHIDTDEYVVASKLLRQMTPSYMTIPSVAEPGSVLNLLQQAVNKTAELVRYPCISMLRVLFGSVESEKHQVELYVPKGYNATQFETLRWRYHGRPHNRTIHGNPKVILDVSAIPEIYFPKEVVYSIHRPVEEFCQKNKELAFTNYRRQPIAVNHYLGSWERYNGRNDKRRSRSVYNQKAFVRQGQDDGVRRWLEGFVESMGGDDHVRRLLGNDYLMSAAVVANSSNDKKSSRRKKGPDTTKTKGIGVVGHSSRGGVNNSTETV